MIDRPLGPLLDEIAAGDSPWPGGGAVACWTLAAAASLVVMAARNAPGWDEAGGAGAQAAAIRWRAEELAEDNSRVFLNALEVRDTPHDREHELGKALDEAAAPPLQLAELATHLTDLARIVGVHTDQTLRAECDIAAVLAAAAARAAVHLLAVNLKIGADDERISHANMLARTAADSVRAALAE